MMSAVGATCTACGTPLVHLPSQADPVPASFILLLQVDARGAVAVTAAAFLANLFESWLGAVAQGRLPWLTNDLVNVLQICVAAALAMAFVTLL